MRILVLLFGIIALYMRMQDWVIEKGISFILNEPTHIVCVKGGKGVFPFTYSFEEITFDDEKGRWLSLKNGVLSMDSLWSFDTINAESLKLFKTPKVYNFQEIPWPSLWSGLSSRTLIRDFFIKKIEILDYLPGTLTISNAPTYRVLKASNKAYALEVYDNQTWKMSCPFAAVKGKGLVSCLAHTYSYGDVSVRCQPDKKKFFLKMKESEAEGTVESLKKINNILFRWKDFSFKGQWNGDLKGKILWKDYVFPCHLTSDLWKIGGALLEKKQTPSSPRPSKIYDVFGHTLEIGSSLQWGEWMISLKKDHFSLYNKKDLLAHGLWTKDKIEGVLFKHVPFIIENSHQQWKLKIPKISFGFLDLSHLVLTPQGLHVERLSLNDLVVKNLKGSYKKGLFSFQSPTLSAQLTLDKLVSLSIPSYKWEWKNSTLHVGKGIIGYQGKLLRFQKIPLKRFLFLPKGFPDIGHATGFVSFDKGNLRIGKLFSLMWNDHRWHFQGPPSFQMSGGVEGNFIARGVLDLSKIPVPIDIRGFADFHLGGNLKNLTGYIDLEKGAYEDEENKVIVENIKGRLKGQGAWLILQNIIGKNVQATGKVSLNEADIRLTLKNYEPLDTDVIYLKSQGFINVRGPWNDLSTQGDLNFLKGEILLDNFTQEAIPTLENIKQKVEKKVLHGSNHNILLRVQKPLKIEGLGLKSQWKGELRVQGETFTPYLMGQLKLAKGTLTVFGKRMTLISGKINYRADDPNEPHIKLLAQRDVKDIKIFLRIHGPSKKPLITFTSFPAFTEDVVLAYFLFEKDIKNAGVFEAFQLTNILSSLKGEKGINILEKLRSQLDFVNIDVKQEEMSSRDFGDKARNFVDISKALGPFTATVSQEMGSGNELRAGVKYPLTPNISANIGTTNNSPVDLGVEFQMRF